MSIHLPKRGIASENLPDIIAGGLPDIDDKNERLTWLKVLIGYTPRLPTDLDDERSWPILPEGVTREDAGKVLEDESFRKKIACEAVDEWLSAEMVAKSIERLQNKLRNNTAKYKEVRIVYPEPANRKYSKNHVPLALAEKLEKMLADVEFPLPFKFVNKMGEGNPLDESIYIVAKGSRGVPKINDVNGNEQKRFTYAVQRLARQVFVAGNVNEDSLYWLIDDGVTAGGTLCSYYNHIKMCNGEVGAITALSKRSTGVEILAVQPESLEFLLGAIKFLVDEKSYSTMRIYDVKEDGQETQNNTLHECVDIRDMFDTWDSVQEDKEYYTKKFCDDISRYMSHVGLSIDFSNFSTTMTNQEVLLLGAYFMHPKERGLWNLLDKALNKIGTSTSQPSYPVKVAELEPGNFEELFRLLSYSHEDRCDLYDEVVVKNKHLPNRWIRHVNDMENGSTLFQSRF